MVVHKETETFVHKMLYKTQRYLLRLATDQMMKTVGLAFVALGFLVVFVGGFDWVYISNCLWLKQEKQKTLKGSPKFAFSEME